LKKEEEKRVDLVLLSENKLMEVEEEALTSLSTLDIVSIIIVLSLVFSTVPVGLCQFTYFTPSFFSNVCVFRTGAEFRSFWTPYGKAF
jgi:hypothetical protein